MFNMFKKNKKITIIKCDSHGIQPLVKFIINDSEAENFEKWACCRCYFEKVTEGLEDFSK